MWATLLKATPGPLCASCAAIASGRVLTLFTLANGGAWEEVELAGADWPARLARVRAAPSVREASVLESGPDRARVRVEVAGCPLQRAVAASGAIPRFPFDVKDGADSWLIIAERERASAFVNDLRASGVRVEIVSSREYHPHDGLTERQREMMKAAIEQGYYEVPRRVTLTRLAQRLGVAKSTLSETLARGERRVLEDLKA